MLEKELDRSVVSKDTSVDTVVLEDESLLEKDKVSLPSEFIVSVGECNALTVLQYSGLHLWWLPKQCNVLFKMSSCKALAAFVLSTFFSLTSLLLMMMAHLTADANRFR